MAYKYLFLSFLIPQHQKCQIRNHRQYLQAHFIQDNTSSQELILHLFYANLCKTKRLYSHHVYANYDISGFSQFKVKWQQHHIKYTWPCLLYPTRQQELCHWSPRLTDHPLLVTNFMKLLKLCTFTQGSLLLNLCLKVKS